MLYAFCIAYQLLSKRIGFSINFQNCFPFSGSSSSLYSTIGWVYNWSAILVKNSMNLLVWMIHVSQDRTHISHRINLAPPHSATPTQRYRNISKKCTATWDSKWKSEHLRFDWLLWILIRFHFRYNKTSVADGIAAVLNAGLDAFIYDGTVLDYLVSQDEDCRLLVVGSWYAMTGKQNELPKKTTLLLFSIETPQKGYNIRKFLWLIINARIVLHLHKISFSSIKDMD